MDAKYAVGDVVFALVGDENGCDYMARVTNVLWDDFFGMYLYTIAALDIDHVSESGVAQTMLVRDPVYDLRDLITSARHARHRRAATGSRP